jgi:hypothetical protein
MKQLRIFGVSLSGQRVGEDCHLTRYPDSMVARAKALRAEGWTLAAIAAALGPHESTVSRWLSGAARKPAARIAVKRVKPPKPPSSDLESPAMPTTTTTYSAVRNSVSNTPPKTHDFSDLA